MTKYILLILLFTSCSKSEFLDKKPDQSLIVPQTLNEFQSVLDNLTIMNGNTEEGYRGINPSFGEISSDNYYVASWLTSSFIPLLKKLYVWDDDFYGSAFQFDDWNLPYKSIFYCNVALDGLNKISSASYDQIAYNNVKGSALFYRAQLFYQLSQIFAPHYQKESSSSDLGIPLKLTSDINEKIVRSNLEETYQLVINDLIKAADLLPSLPLGGFKTRPSKCAAFGLLSRIYLTMEDYDLALKYANESLDIYDKLVDYNTLDFSETYPLPRYNDEVIYHSILISSGSSILMGSSARTRVDSNLFKSYQKDDLRRQSFFRANRSFRGSYDGTSSFFGGVATDEILLNRAECKARLNNLAGAMEDLNKLLRTRWNNTVIFPEFTATSSEEALSIILAERRKELVFRGLRWTDLRRINSKGANISITRILDGQTYTLAPNSKHYTFLIPPDIMSFNPGWPQNPR